MNTTYGALCHDGKPHKNTKLGPVYESCEDCGGVRKRLDLPGSASDRAWHSCNTCRLPPGKTP